MVDVSRESPTIDLAVIDWSRVQSCELKLDWRLRYAYTKPITNLTHTLMVSPRERPPSQTATNERVWVEGRPEKFSAHSDRFGNTEHVVKIDRVESDITFRVSSSIRRRAVNHVTEKVPDEVVDELKVPTALTTTNAAMRDVVAAQMVAGLRPRELALALSAAVSASMTYDLNATTIRTTAAEAWTMGRGMCQDYSQILIGMLRDAGIAARYAAGLGAGIGASHAWVEALIPVEPGRYEILALDPTNDGLIGPRYVSLGVGKDRQDTLITAGTFTGVMGAHTYDRNLSVTSVRYSGPALRAGAPTGS